MLRLSASSDSPSPASSSGLDVFKNEPGASATEFGDEVGNSRDGGPTRPRKDQDLTFWW